MFFEPAGSTCVPSLLIFSGQHSILHSATMKFLRGIVLSLLVATANARLGGRRVGGRDYSGNEDIELVVVFEDDDEDAFTEMSTTFTGLADNVEVHSMLTKLKMATVRAKPAVSVFENVAKVSVSLSAEIAHALRRVSSLNFYFVPGCPCLAR